MFHQTLLVFVSVSIPHVSDSVKTNSDPKYEQAEFITESKNKSTTEYNYITTEEYIKSELIKYQTILP